ncbi:MAG: TAXI family TRAP transporter solute-binding subunit [Pseudonocardiaceae bacterium]
MTEIPRRTLLTALALGLTAGGVCGNLTYRGPQRTLTIAAGESGGLYLAFAELLATEIGIAEPRLRVTAIPTKGSLDNLQRLGAGEVDLALVLADAAQAATSTGADPGRPAPMPIQAIGRVYENYLQLVVLAASPIRTLADLAGRTVSLGADGSGAGLTGDRLLTAAGLTPAAPPAAVIVQHHPLSDAITALKEGRIDALLWSGGVPTPALAELSARHGIRLLPLGTALTALQSAHGLVYHLVTVPADAYSRAPEVTTIGVANLLVCRPGTDPAVTATARVLVTHAARLVPQQVLGTQFLDPRSLITTAGIPLHPDAITAYRALHG